MKFQIISFVLMFMVVGCGGSGETVNEPTRINHQRAQEMMELYDVIILDVRSEGEFASGHIQGAVLLPAPRIPFEAEALIPDTAQIILLYCQSGNRSVGASRALAELGFTAVYDFGGINGWPGTIVQ